MTSICSASNCLCSSILRRISSLSFLASSCSRRFSSTNANKEKTFVSGARGGAFYLRLSLICCSRAAKTSFISRSRACFSIFHWATRFCHVFSTYSVTNKNVKRKDSFFLLLPHSISRPILFPFASLLLELLANNRDIASFPLAALSRK